MDVRLSSTLAGGKEFLNKIAAELYQILDIRTTHTAPAHPQCNSQAEVISKISEERGG
jgi:hypothetical protein